MFNKKQIFKNAWVQAENAAFIHGGSKVEYFAECLRNEWAFAKQMEQATEVATQRPARIERTTNEIVEIKSWFVRKNFSQQEAYVIETNDWIEVLQETQKAYRVKVHNAKYGHITSWVPKSCTVA